MNIGIDIQKEKEEIARTVIQPACHMEGIESTKRQGITCADLLTL